MKLTFLLPTAAALLAVASLVYVTDAGERNDGDSAWTSLFNEKNLDGWTVKCLPKDIVCKGTRIKTVMNGVTIADCDGAGRLDDEAHRNHNVGMKGHIGLQIHPGKELLIRFKDIEVKELD